MKKARIGCCDACGGLGISGEEVTNGACWDCRGTGHPHSGPCATRRSRFLWWWGFTGSPLVILGAWIFLATGVLLLLDVLAIPDAIWHGLWFWGAAFPLLIGMPVWVCVDRLAEQEMGDREEGTDMLRWNDRREFDDDWPTWIRAPREPDGREDGVQS